MTEISRRHWDYITQDNLSPREVVNFLNSDLALRSFSEVLCRLYPQDNLKERLLAAISSRKNVENWLADRNLPENREEVFQIAFALELNEGQTDELLSYVFEEGIHYRSKRELIYVFFLKNQRSYEEALQCAAAFPEQETADSTDEAVLTRPIRHSFGKLQSETELCDFLKTYGSSLGPEHNTAYRYFTRMLSILQGEEAEDEEIPSTVDIAQQYLRLHMPSDRKTSAYSAVQKLVKKYWPGARSIGAMKKRHEDVSRKVLLLLYVATGGPQTEPYDELDEDYVSRQQRLLTHCRRIDEMLELSGMRVLDPRNPFDFLVLYCIQVENGELMSERMESVVDELFAV
jgi:hypothetical protein